MPSNVSKNPGQRQYRNGSKYTVAERKILEPFKEAFRSEESKAGRLEILKSEILPAIFNYWASIEPDPMEEEESRRRAKVSYQACPTLYYRSHRQELTNWLSNNWRKTQGPSRKSNNFKVKRSEAIWSLHQDRVFKEIARMLGVDEATTTTPGWLPMRLPAIKRVYESMTEDERAVLHTEKEKMMMQGYSEQKKRRYVKADADADADAESAIGPMFHSLAEKYLCKRVEETARQQWLEMGVVSVTLTAYTDPSGLLVIDA